jgi:hypothetical protein
MSQPAKSTLLAYLAVFRTEKAAGMFAPDGALELPYLTSLDLQTRYVGRPEIKGFLDTVLSLYPDWSFPPEDSVEHLFMGRMTLQDGQITLPREGINTVATAQALLPDGPAAIPVPTGVVHSF